jgi:hypothetical protein
LARENFKSSKSKELDSLGLQLHLVLAGDLDQYDASQLVDLFIRDVIDGKVN